MGTRGRLASALCAGVFALAIGGVALGDDAKCQDGVAKGSRNVGNQEQKKNRKCVKDGAGDVSGCVSTEGAKAAIKRGKLVDLYAGGGKCDPVPVLGVNSDPNDIADGTEDASGDILRGAFGDPVDGVEADSKCHDKIAKRAGKKFDTELKAFRSCVKDAAPLASQAVLDGCVTSGVNDTKAQGTVQPKLEADMGAQCTFASPPAGLEDGDCSTCVAAPDCADCIGDIVDCQACLAMNNSSNGTADCDVLDDGLANASCGECPIVEGQYTVTQLAGGTLRVFSFAAFPFPAGGSIVQDVAAGLLPACIHDTVVPFPGGFNAPNFCVPALGYTVSVTQTGCGIGEMDSNGGSDYKVEELNDTSNTGAPCNLPHLGCAPGSDASIRVDVTVGDSLPDVCAGTGKANALVTVPVHTVTWQDNSGGMFGPVCLGDGVFNAGDMVISEFDQILDFTTDEAHASWADIDGDLCAIAGLGPPAGQTLVKGECLNTNTLTIKTVAAGGFGSTNFPNDGSFRTSLPNTVALTGVYAGTTCVSAPAINIAGGTVTRCLP